MEQWTAIEQLLIGLAEHDLRAEGEVRPTLFAGRGEELLLIAGVRPFPKHGYQDPLIELLALACPLGADRLAVSIGGRAWSLNDPLPPVVDGVGDLRQRVLCLDLAVAGEPQRSVVRPYEMAGDEVCWGDMIEQMDTDGWIGSALRIAVTQGLGVVPQSELRRQARRCARLGHALTFSPEAGERIA